MKMLDAHGISAELRSIIEKTNDFVFVKNCDSVYRTCSKGYRILLRTFGTCAETKKDSVCALRWRTSDGRERKYHGYVHYRGRIGNAADLAATFMNVTDVNSFGFTEE